MKEFKPVILFIVKFLAVYFLLLFAYNRYLSHYHSAHHQDPYSHQVAKWSATVANLFGFSSKVEDDKIEPWTWVYMDDKKTSYINEGCNAISIMIIFVAFIVAFSSTRKTTLLYILLGLIIIQVMNVLRIFLLNFIFRYHDSYGKLAHDYFFPLIIYGTIFILWVFWVSYVLKKKAISNESTT